MVKAIDPPFCSCTECLTGEYVPVNRANGRQIFEMLFLKTIRDNTGMHFSTTYVIEAGYDDSQGDRYTWAVK